jgi:glycosyltransferase involved in cell wall biosynthesis
MSSRKPLEYVLITPARNEQEFLEETIQSVISQTILPKRWIIVSDGSTDRTDEIVQGYMKDHEWLELLRTPDHGDRHFGAKVIAFNAGYARIAKLSFDIVGNLDADLSFESDYFEYLLNKFAEHPDLGVAGTPFLQDSTFQYNYRYTNIEHVSGACQLFRRRCFEEVGGYIPIKGGGVDWVAVTTARMKGWKTRTFTDKILVHHRRIGTEQSSTLKAAYQLGQKDYYLGNHPLWEFFRCVYQMRYKPYFVGGLVIQLGYLKAQIGRLERPIPPELIAFIRSEQLKRLLEKMRLQKQGS